jgi:hypothetical protein
MEDMEMRIKRADHRQERVDAIQVRLRLAYILAYWLTAESQGHVCHSKRSRTEAGLRKDLDK